jgi:hypothetical protein
MLGGRVHVVASCVRVCARMGCGAELDRASCCRGIWLAERQRERMCGGIERDWSEVSVSAAQKAGCGVRASRGQRGKT